MKEYQHNLTYSTEKTQDNYSAVHIVNLILLSIDCCLYAQNYQSIMIMAMLIPCCKIIWVLPNLSPLDLVVSKFKNSAKILNVFKYKFMEIS